MPFLGSTPATGYTTLVKQDLTPDGATAAFTLTIPSTTEGAEVFVNNVRQEPGSAYNVSGTTLTFTSTPANTDSIYVVFQGGVRESTTIPFANSITTSMLVDGSITAAKIANGTVVESEIANGAVTSAKLSYPLTTFSSTGIDDNATAIAITIDSSENIKLANNVGMGADPFTSSNYSTLNIRNTTGGQLLMGRDSGTNNWDFFAYSANTHSAIGTTANTYLTFHTDSTGVSNERMRIDVNGNVGIGNTTPAVQLHIEEIGTGSGEGDLIIATASDGGNAGLRFRTGGSDRFSITTIGTANSESLRFRDVNNNAERMRIDDVGNVGIGTTDPSATLEIAKTGAGAQLLLTQSGTDQLGLLAGTLGTGLVYENENYFGIWSQDYADRGTENNMTERMRIDSSGNVGIGKTPTYRLDVSSGADEEVARFQSTGSFADVYLQDNGTSTGQVRLRAQSNTLKFITNTTERMQITADGRVFMNEGPSATLGGFGTEPYGGMNVYPDAGFVAINADTTNSALYVAKTAAATAGYINFATAGTTRGAIVESGTNIGIQFGGTATGAHTFDDYEEGTWTPSMSTSAFNGAYSMTVQKAVYRKIGATVFYSAYISAINVTTQGTGTMRIYGLPFTGSSESNSYSGGVSVYGTMIAHTRVHINAPSGTYLRLMHHEPEVSGSPQGEFDMTAAELGTGSKGSWIFQGFYTTD